MNLLYVKNKISEREEADKTLQLLMTSS